MIKFSNINNKGFMLAEVVITSSVIAVTLVTSFITLNGLKSSYERRNRYYDLDAEQIAIEADKNSGNVAGLEEAFEATSGYDINNIYNLNSIADLNTLTVSDDNYISYLKNNLDSSVTYTKIVIVEIKKKDNNYYYYALKVKE